jgi:hypothetical protein
MFISSRIYGIQRKNLNSEECKELAREILSFAQSVNVNVQVENIKQVLTEGSHYYDNGEFFACDDISSVDKNPNESIVDLFQKYYPNGL